MNIKGNNIKAEIEMEIKAKSLVFLVFNPQIERIASKKKEISGNKTANKGSPIK